MEDTIFSSPREFSIFVVVMFDGSVIYNQRTIKIVQAHQANLIVSQSLKTGKLFHEKDRIFKRWNGPLPGDIVHTLIDWHLYAIQLETGKKSAVTNQVADRLGVSVVDRHLSRVIGEDDLIGLPVIKGT